MVTVQNQNFSLEQICESGQCFRFNRLNGCYDGQLNDNRYAVIAFGRYLELEQQGDSIHFFCEQEEYNEIWEDYFDIKTDYRSFITSVKKEDEYLYRAVQYGYGIRILKQDIWEMVITFIISQQNNIKRIRKCVETLAARYGERKTKPEGGDYYSFPGPEALAAASEEELRDCNLGYRSRYIRQTALNVLNGDVVLDSLWDMPYGEAKQELLKLSGIGGKVADCICLFALHKTEAFPVDTHIKQVFERYYPQGFPYENYPGYAGVIQQYIFYYDLKKPDNGN